MQRSPSMLGQLSETKQLPFLLKASRCGGTEDDVVKFEFDCWKLNLSFNPASFTFFADVVAVYVIHWYLLGTVVLISHHVQWKEFLLTKNDVRMQCAVHAGPVYSQGLVHSSTPRQDTRRKAPCGCFTEFWIGKVGYRKTYSLIVRQEKSLARQGTICVYMYIQG